MKKSVLLLCVFGVLFNCTGCAGLPADDYSIAGQNYGEYGSGGKTVKSVIPHQESIGTKSNDVAGKATALYAIGGVLGAVLVCVGGYLGYMAAYNDSVDDIGVGGGVFAGIIGAGAGMLIGAGIDLVVMLGAGLVVLSPEAE